MAKNAHLFSPLILAATILLPWISGIIGCGIYMANTYPYEVYSYASADEAFHTAFQSGTMLGALLVGPDASMLATSIYLFHLLKNSARVNREFYAVGTRMFCIPFFIVTTVAFINGYGHLSSIDGPTPDAFRYFQEFLLAMYFGVMAASFVLTLWLLRKAWSAPNVSAK